MDNNAIYMSDHTLKEIKIWFEWFRAERKSKGIVHDIDLFAVAVNKNDKISRETDLVFYGNSSDPAHILYLNDDHDCWHETEDDSINVNLKNATIDIHRIIIMASIHDADVRRQNFSQLTSLYMYNNIEIKSNRPFEIQPFEFVDLPPTPLIVLCEIIRTNNGWLFVPTGTGLPGGIIQFLTEHGLDLG